MPLPLHGRVFDRYRAFEKLSETLQQQVTSVAGALATDKVFGVQSVSLFQSAFGVKGDKLVEFVKKASRDADADKVIDGLVLNGTLALHKEDAEAATQVENFLKRNNALFVPTDNKVAGRASEHSVWSVRDGAIEAGPVKRAARLFGAKDAYAVANEKLKGLYIFDDDVALELKSKIDLDGAFVEFDKTLEHGIKVSKDEEALYIGVQSKDAQEEWLNSIINAGATYREAFNVDTENVKSVYELKDRDMQGNEVPMDKYKGKVLLIVNVSSKCGLTPTNYPELAALDEKYRDQGLEILAFPCNQFARQEPGTHEEIMEFVKKYDCKFQFFEKADVNGANARPVFTYLKAQLPGSFGNFVKWNFTKFLVDRNGKPYKRYAPKDLPFSFEEDIKTLLAQPAGGETASKETKVEVKEEVKTEAKEDAKTDAQEEVKAEPVKTEDVTPKTEETEPKAEDAKEETPKTE